MPSALAALALAALLTLAAAASSRNPCHSNRRLQSNGQKTCLKYVLPRRLCMDCRLRPYSKITGKFTDCGRIYDLSQSSCQAQLRRYAEMNPCDKLRNQQVQDFNNNDNVMGLDYFVYSICEMCCDCVPRHARPGQYADRKKDGLKKNLDLLMKVDRANCPAHAVADVCKVWPNVRAVFTEDEYDALQGGKPTLSSSPVPPPADPSAPAKPSTIPPPPPPSKKPPTPPKNNPKIPDWRDIPKPKRIVCKKFKCKSGKRGRWCRRRNARCVRRARWRTRRNLRVYKRKVAATKKKAEQLRKKLRKSSRQVIVLTKTARMMWDDNFLMTRPLVCSQMKAWKNAQTKSLYNVDEIDITRPMRDFMAKFVEAASCRSEITWNMCANLEFTQRRI